MNINVTCYIFSKGSSEDDMSVILSLVQKYGIDGVKYVFNEKIKPKFFQWEKQAKKILIYICSGLPLTLNSY